MNKRHISLFLILLLIFLIFTAIKIKTKESKLGEAGTIVKIFCKLDGLGIRLTSDNWKYIQALVNWKDGPGWDHLYIIENFKITKETHKENQAFVDVSYHLISFCSGENPCKKLDEVKNFTYKLAYINGDWKIVAQYPQFPQPPPHIFKKTYEEMSNGEEF